MELTERAHSHEQLTYAHDSCALLQLYCCLLMSVSSLTNGRSALWHGHVSCQD